MFCHGLINQIIRVLAFPHRSSPSQTEIGDTELTRPGHQEIAWLEVTVDDTMVVEELEPFKELVHEVPVVGIGKGLGGLDDTVKIRVQQLHDYVQLIISLTDE